jgi:3-oxoacyl-[acyl-carrier protein] reductase
MTPPKQAPAARRRSTVVVTGAASGIGRAIAISMLDAGWRVAATDTAEAALRRTNWPKAGRDRLMTRALDVTKPGEVAKVFDQIARAFGRVDGLVNCAGIFDEASIVELDDERWSRLVDVNLAGAQRCLRAALRHMNPKRGGRILNIASIAAVVGLPFGAHYSASKAGLVALTRSAALELAATKIRVNALLPGLVDTPMLGAHRRDRYLDRRVPIGRIARPEEVAELARFLLTSSSDYITGASFTIDGGLSIR